MLCPPVPTLFGTTYRWKWLLLSVIYRYPLLSSRLFFTRSPQASGVDFRCCIALTTESSIKYHGNTTYFQSTAAAKAPRSALELANDAQQTEIYRRTRERCLAVSCQPVTHLSGFGNGLPHTYITQLNLRSTRRGVQFATDLWTAVKRSEVAAEGRCRPLSCG